MKYLIILLLPAYCFGQSRNYSTRDDGLFFKTLPPELFQKIEGVYIEHDSMQIGDVKACSFAMQEDNVIYLGIAFGNDKDGWHADGISESVIGRSTIDLDTATICHTLFLVIRWEDKHNCCSPYFEDHESAIQLWDIESKKLTFSRVVEEVQWSAPGQEEVDGAWVQSDTSAFLDSHECTQEIIFEKHKIALSPVQCEFINSSYDAQMIRNPSGDFIYDGVDWIRLVD